VFRVISSRTPRSRKTRPTNVNFPPFKFPARSHRGDHCDTTTHHPWTTTGPEKNLLVVRHPKKNREKEGQKKQGKEPSSSFSTRTTTEQSQQLLQRQGLATTRRCIIQGISERKDTMSSGSNPMDCLDKQVCVVDPLAFASWNKCKVSQRKIDLQVLTRRLSLPSPIFVSNLCIDFIVKRQKSYNHPHLQSTAKFCRATPPICTWPMAPTPSRPDPLVHPSVWQEKWSSTRAWWDIPKP
jgi:hypothetical protein